MEVKRTPLQGGIEEGAEFYDVEVLREASNGQIIMEAVPYGEFFITETLETTKVLGSHGHRRSVTVAEAIEMGLDCDNWWDLDDEDPETAKVGGQANERRGYNKETEEE